MRSPLLLSAVLSLAVLSSSQDAAEDISALPQDTQQPAAETPADENRDLVPRAIGEPNQDGKFSVYIGTIDGVRRMVFNEVEGGDDRVPADNSINPRDPFGAYDDTHVVNAENEKMIFVPKPYRPGKKEEETTTTTTTRRPTTRPHTTRRPVQQLRPVALPSPPRVQLPSRNNGPLVLRPTLTTSAPFVATTPRLPPPTTAIATADPASLRTGLCQNSIFYISTPINGPTRLTFTHFAIAVTVDQCARTCHEFNCAIAHYNPINGHCEFNPSTAFAIRNGQCPAWPSLHYRNNVVASEPVRIFCVACQKPRRRINRGKSSRRSLLGISNSEAAQGVVSHSRALSSSAFAEGFPHDE